MPDSPFYEVASALKEIIDAEFAPEGLVSVLDNIHEALGLDRPRIGIAPIEDLVNPLDAVVQETWVEVRFFDVWKKEISPETLIDPVRITDFAHRFRDAIRRHNEGLAGTDKVWYFDVRRVQYPNDPTGNKSRFVATIRAFGNNNGLVETAA